MAKFNYTKKTSKVGSTKASTAQSLKTSHRKQNSKLSLKAFVRSLPPSDERVATWFHNKSVSTSKGPLGIGATRKKKAKPGQTSSLPFVFIGAVQTQDPLPSCG